MHHGVAEFDEAIGRDVVEILDREFGFETLTPTLDGQLHFLADAVIEHIGQRIESCKRLAIHPNQDVTGLEHLLGRRARLHLAYDQKTRGRRKLPADFSFGLGTQSQPAHFVERGVLEYGLQRAARHGLTFLDVLERARDAIERQIEARCRLGAATCVQCNDATFDIDHR